jgi:SPP1 gp7 family putative phage head morphogenesis protein
MSDINERFVWDEGDYTVTENTEEKEKADYTEDEKEHPDIRTFFKATRIKPINPDRKDVRTPREKLARLLEKILAEALRSCLEAFHEGAATAKADEDPPLGPGQARKVLQALDEFDWAVLVGPATQALRQIGLAGVDAAAQQLGVADDDRIFEAANPQAIAYAEQRGAELVGKRVLADGTVIENPVEKWRIDQSTRDWTQRLVTSAEEEGWSATTFGKALEECEAFWPSRAMMVARTESAFADMNGNVATYREAGVQMKAWLDDNEEGACDECAANAEQGPIPFDEDFQSGDPWPPAHPNCRCSLEPIFVDWPDND